MNTPRHFDNEYAELKSLIAEMSTLASTMVSQSIQALVDRDTELARKVIETDDRLDELDIEIDEHCQRIIALYQPKASDLRYIITALRIIVDLERVGDQCENICEEVIGLNEIPQIKPYIDLPKMGEAAAQMVRDSVSAYFNRDTDLAFEVIKRDDVIDNLHSQILRELFTYIVEDTGKLKGAIGLMMITRSIERIADHATNVAELVHFMVSGKIVRHTYIEDADNGQDTGH